MHRVLSSAAAAALALWAVWANAAEPPETVDVQVTGHILMPKAVEPTDDPLDKLKLPSGFTIDLPDGAQHPNRTLAVGPDSMLYVSVGSSCNACQESNPEHATILQMKPDGTQRKIFASGLRNTIGFGWHPEEFNYEVVRVRFEDGKPQAIEPFITGFLTEDQGSFGYIGRPVGLAISRDGSLFIGDDSNGVIYRVSYDSPKAAEAGATPSKPTTNAAVVEQDTPKQLARDILGQAPTLDVITPAFEANGKIPLRHSAYGQDFSPALKWGKAPEGSKSFAILMQDPDAAKPTPFVHWILYNVPAEVTELAEGVPGVPSLPLPEGARQGVNDRGSFGYFGPKPPDEKDHHYHFQVFALDTTLDLPTNAARKDILEAMKGHVLAQGEIVGVFNKSQSVDDGA